MGAQRVQIGTLGAMLTCNMNAADKAPPHGMPLRKDGLQDDAHIDASPDEMAQPADHWHVDGRHCPPLAMQQDDLAHTAARPATLASQHRFHHHESPGTASQPRSSPEQALDATAEAPLAFAPHTSFDPKGSSSPDMNSPLSLHRSVRAYNKPHGSATKHALASSWDAEAWRKEQEAAFEAEIALQGQHMLSIVGTEWNALGAARTQEAQEALTALRDTEAKLNRVRPADKRPCCHALANAH